VSVALLKLSALVREITVNLIILLFNLAAFDLSAIFPLMFKVGVADDAYRERTFHEAKSYIGADRDQPAAASHRVFHLSTVFAQFRW
jgi:hypothetical protein